MARPASSGGSLDQLEQDSGGQMTNKQYRLDTKKLMTLKRRCEKSQDNNLPLYQSDSEHLTAPPKHTICK
ncbi:hypothetical protein J4Q44_G00234770 [Coregonus suidteri]|uniref:Uncharacterized protein n=1 Tax=Coregonus suidteri TaxID=861788 RepID=A0AAN8LDV9_9TELE